MTLGLSQNKAPWCGGSPAVIAGDRVVIRGDRQELFKSGSDVANGRPPGETEWRRVVKTTKHHGLGPSLYRVRARLIRCRENGDWSAGWRAPSPRPCRRPAPRIMSMRTRASPGSHTVNVAGASTAVMLETKRLGLHDGNTKRAIGLLRTHSDTDRTYGMSIRNPGFLLSCARPLSAVEDTHSGRRAGPWCASLAVAGLVLALGLIHSSPGHSQQASKAGAAETIEFGANTSAGARDGLCADVRFENNPTSARPGMAQDLITEDIFRDASDCYRAYVDNTVHLRENVDGIDFGTDQGSRDYTCQDSRFAPLRMSGERPAAAEPKSEGADASDCLLAYIAENVGLYDSTLHVVFGNDWGQWPNDGQCDDPRFRNAPGAGEPLMAEYTNTANVGRGRLGLPRGDARGRHPIATRRRQGPDQFRGRHGPLGVRLRMRRRSLSNRSTRYRAML